MDREWHWKYKCDIDWIFRPAELYMIADVAPHLGIPNHDYKTLQKVHFFFHMAYLCRAWQDSCDFTLDMLKCYTKHTTIVRKHLH